MIGPTISSPAATVIFRSFSGKHAHSWNVSIGTNFAHLDHAFAYLILQQLDQSHFVNAVMAFNQSAALIFDRIKVIAIVRPDQAPRLTISALSLLGTQLQIFVPLHVGNWSALFYRRLPESCQCCPRFFVFSVYCYDPKTLRSDSPSGLRWIILSAFAPFRPRNFFSADKIWSIDRINNQFEFLFSAVDCQDNIWHFCWCFLQLWRAILLKGACVLRIVSSLQLYPILTISSWISRHRQRMVLIRASVKHIIKRKNIAGFSSHCTIAPFKIML